MDYFSCDLVLLLFTFCHLQRRLKGTITTEHGGALSPWVLREVQDKLYIWLFRLKDLLGTSHLPVCCNIIGTFGPTLGSLFYISHSFLFSLPDCDFKLEQNNNEMAWSCVFSLYLFTFWQIGTLRSMPNEISVVPT